MLCTKDLILITYSFSSNVQAVGNFLIPLHKRTNFSTNLIATKIKKKKKTKTSQWN